MTFKERLEVVMAFGARLEEGDWRRCQVVLSDGNSTDYPGTSLLSKSNLLTNRAATFTAFKVHYVSVTDRRAAEAARGTLFTWLPRVADDINEPVRLDQVPGLLDSSRSLQIAVLEETKTLRVMRALRLSGSREDAKNLLKNAVTF